MASGTLNFNASASSGSYIDSKVVWSSTPNQDANTSDVTAKLYVRKGDTNQTLTIATKGTWSYKLTVNGSSASGSVSLSVLEDWVLVATKTVTGIAHGSNGTKSITISASVSAPSGTSFSGHTTSGSGTATLDTISRESTVSASAGTLGTAQNLTVTRQASSYTHTITYKCGSASGTVCTKSSSTSISWTPPMTLAKQNTTGSSVRITLTITTYNGSTQIGSAKTTTFTASIPDSVKPTVSVSVADVDGHIGKYGSYVQNQSRIEVTVTGTGAQGSTIKSISVTAGSATGTSSPLVGLVTVAPTDYAKGSVTDSRSRSSAVDSIPVEVLAYSKPKVLNFSANRCNADGIIQSDGEYAKAVFSGKVSALNSRNSATYKVLYREQGTADWTVVEVTDAAGVFAPSGISVVFPADVDKAFEVVVSVADDFHEITSSYRSFGIAFSLLQTTSDFTGLAVGQRAVKPNTFAVGIHTELNSTVSAFGFVQTGTVKVTPTEEGKPVSADVLFDRPFAGTPVVVATARSDYPGTKLLGVTVTSASKSGFTIHMARTNIVETPIYWIAAYQPNIGTEVIEA